MKTTNLHSTLHFSQFSSIVSTRAALCGAPVGTQYCLWYWNKHNKKERIEEYKRLNTRASWDYYWITCEVCLLLLFSGEL